MGATIMGKKYIKTKLCPKSIKVKETETQAKGYACKDGDGISYLFPCTVEGMKKCRYFNK